MFVLLRRYRSSLSLLVLAGVIGVIAIADHSYKQTRIDRAQVAEWHCYREGIDCGGTSWETMEAHWNERQVAYEAIVFTLAVGSAGLFALKRRKDRSIPSVNSGGCRSNTSA
jgi:hypothetical protein